MSALRLILKIVNSPLEILGFREYFLEFKVK